MSAQSLKNGGYASDVEVDSQDLHLQSKVRTLRLLEAARTGITALALLMGLTVLGVSADALSVYNSTVVSPAFLLPLWPDEFNLRPTVALVAGSAIVIVANLVSLALGKVQRFRSMKAAHNTLMFTAPFVGLVAAVVAMAVFYAANASSTTDTLPSWTCRWRALTMTQQPYWGQLCRESWAGIYLAVLLVPVEALVAGLAGYQLLVERHASAYAHARKGSPSMS